MLHRTVNARHLGVAAGIALLCAAPLVVPLAPSVWRIGALAWVCVILACGLHVVTGLARVISLCHFGLAGIGAYAAAALSVRAGFPCILSIVGGAALAGAAALLIGLLTRRLADHYLTLGTLAVNEILGNVFRGATELTGGVSGFGGVAPLKILGKSLSEPNQYYVAAAVVGVVVVGCIWLLERLPIGHALKAVGDVGERATSLGVSDRGLRAVAFMIGGVLAGLAGGLLAHMDGFVGPESFGVAPSVFYLCFLVLAGLGRLRGVFVTACGAVIATELLRNLHGWQMIVLSLVTFGVMLGRARRGVRIRPGGGAS